MGSQKVTISTILLTPFVLNSVTSKTIIGMLVIDAQRLVTKISTSMPNGGT